MKVLIAEDEKDLLSQYRTILEDNNHSVVTAEDGETCLKLYESKLKNLIKKFDEEDYQTPFDAVVLDYMMPKKNGLDVAKEILKICPKQRIIFASAYIQNTLADSIKNLKQIVELLEKPVGLQRLVDTIEDKKIYHELEKLNVDIRNLKELNPTHAQIRDYLSALTNIQQGRVR